MKVGREAQKRGGDQRIDSVPCTHFPSSLAAGWPCDPALTNQVWAELAKEVGAEGSACAGPFLSLLNAQGTVPAVQTCVLEGEARSDAKMLVPAHTVSSPLQVRNTKPFV